jgi:phage tail-like protein
MTEQKSSRRRFLGGAAGTAGVAMALLNWRGTEAAAATINEGTSRELAARPLPGATFRSPAAPRTFTAGKFQLDLGGVSAGFLKGAEGGYATSDVVVEKLGPDHINRKHIGGVKYEDVELNAGTGMSKNFYEWVKSSFENKHFRNDGSIRTTDYDGNMISEIQFFQGLISEIGFPALDAASKDSAKMTVKFKPEYTRFKRGGGRVKLPPDNQKQKMWLPRNFKLKIDGLDCSRVTKIEALVLKQTVVDNSVGQVRDGQAEPGALEVPNLQLTMPLVSAQSFLDWHEDFVIKGNNSQDKEKTGSLQYLTEDLRDVLFQIDFFGLGIFALDDGDDDTGDGDQIKRIRCELYCEQMRFSYGSMAWA